MNGSCAQGDSGLTGPDFWWFVLGMMPGGSFGLRNMGFGLQVKVPSSSHVNMHLGITSALSLTLQNFRKNPKP